MPHFYVQIPFAGSMSFEVEAASEEEAIEKAFDEDFLINIDNQGGSAELGEFEMYEQICRGNVLYAPLNGIEVEEV